MQQIDDHEQFLCNMTLALSNYIILVMHETNLYGQKFLFDVAKKWHDLRFHDYSRCQDIIVVHTFRTTDTDQERDELFLVRNCTRNRLNNNGDIFSQSKVQMTYLTEF